MYVVVKTVDTKMIGCVVGPFKSEHAANNFAKEASRYCLGYEKWIVRELTKPSPLLGVPE